MPPRQLGYRRVSDASDFQYQLLPSDMAPAAVGSGPSFDKDRIALYEGKTTSAVIIIAIVAASGGLLFGEWAQQRRSARMRSAQRRAASPLIQSVGRLKGLRALYSACPLHPSTSQASGLAQHPLPLLCTPLPLAGHASHRLRQWHVSRAASGTLRYVLHHCSPPAMHVAVPSASNSSALSGRAWLRTHGTTAPLDAPPPNRPIPPSAPAA